MPVCTAANNTLSSSATDVYSVLNESHTLAAASNDPGPGPLESAAECTSGGDAIQIGAVIVRNPQPAPPLSPVVLEAAPAGVRR
jgi:hypothetical protein